MPAVHDRARDAGPTSRCLIAGKPDVVSASGAVPTGRRPVGDVPPVLHPAGVPGSSGGESVARNQLLRGITAATINQFMGSAAIPLSVDEYVQRYKPQDVPHVYIENREHQLAVRVDMILPKGGGTLLSVLLLAGRGCEFPLIETMKFLMVPHAYVGMPAPDA